MADEALWVWRYELRSAQPLNALASGKVFQGALLRYGSGFACVHPWPELGDLSLEECLKGWPLNSIGQQTISCLALDGQARENGVSLFEGAIIPPSHATLPVVNDEILQECRERGFTHVKVKVSNNLSEIRPLIEKNTDLCWRLDFNGTGRPDMFDDWSEEERARLDFVEDPFPPEQGLWGRLRVTTASDRYRVKAPVCILKPAVEPMLTRGRRTVVTSYMDHPLGQSFAACEAARWSIKEVCGLQTHGLFEKDAFSEALGEVGPEFHPAAGTGLGFDELLEKLPWKKHS